jgi:hypothetical protein
MNLPIVGLEAVRRELGDFRGYILPDGTMARSWEANVLGTIHLPEPLALGWVPETKVSKIRFHEKLCPQLEAVLRAIHDAGLWRELKTFDGAYNFRPQRGSEAKPSAHCWAAALDVAAVWNKRHERPTMHPAIVSEFEARGWVWGGKWGPQGADTVWLDGQWTRPGEVWTRCDGMHFSAVDF